MTKVRRDCSRVSPPQAQLSSKPGEAGAAGAVSYKNCIQLAACAAGQSLPMNPELPADLFTACLTTPVKMAMKWFVLRSRTTSDVHDLIDKYDLFLFIIVQWLLRR